MLDKIIKQKLNEEKKRLLSEKQLKDQLLSSKSDWSLLEKLVQEINLQPDLKIEVHLNDGTVLYLRCYDDNENKIKDDGIEPIFEDDPAIKIRKFKK